MIRKAEPLLNNLMYEYIKGKKVQMEEHMLSATELAQLFGLYTLNNNPNGLLVAQILSDYVEDTNLNVSEYYYPHRKGVLRVYPELVYRKALYDFVFNLEDGEKKVYVSKHEKKKINFIYREPKTYNRIISFNGKRKEI